VFSEVRFTLVRSVLSRPTTLKLRLHIQGTGDHVEHKDELTPLESRLVECAAAGEELDCAPTGVTQTSSIRSTTGMIGKFVLRYY